MNKTAEDLSLRYSEQDLPYEEFLDDYEFYTRVEDDDQDPTLSPQFTEAETKSATGRRPSQSLKTTLWGLLGRKKERAKGWQSEGALVTVMEHAQSNHSADKLYSSSSRDAVAENVIPRGEGHRRAQSQGLPRNSHAAGLSHGRIHHSPTLPAFQYGSSGKSSPLTTSSPLRSPQTGASPGGLGGTASMAPSHPAPNQMDGNAAPALGRTQSLAEAQAAVPLWGTDLMNEINQAAKARAQALDSQGGKDGVVSMPQQAQVKGHKKSRSLV